MLENKQLKLFQDLLWDFMVYTNRVETSGKDSVGQKQLARLEGWGRQTPLNEEGKMLDFVFLGL